MCTISSRAARNGPDFPPSFRSNPSTRAKSSQDKPREHHSFNCEWTLLGAEIGNCSSYNPSSSRGYDARGAFAPQSPPIIVEERAVHDQESS